MTETETLRSEPLGRSRPKLPKCKRCGRKHRRRCAVPIVLPRAPLATIGEITGERKPRSLDELHQALRRARADMAALRAKLGKASAIICDLVAWEEGADEKDPAWERAYAWADGTRSDE